MYRWLTLVVTATALGITTYFRRRARLAGDVIERRREGGVVLAGRAAVGLPLWLGVVAYVVNPGWLGWSALSLPSSLRWMGAAVATLALPGVFWTLRALGTNVSETVLTKSTQKLVKSGPYRWVRHPLYAVGIALFIGVGLMSDSGFILAFAILALVLIRLVVIPLEERELMTRFGDEYRIYMRGTGRLLPRVKGSPREADRAEH